MDLFISREALMAEIMAHKREKAFKGMNRAFATSVLEGNETVKSFYQSYLESRGVASKAYPTRLFDNVSIEEASQIVLKSLPL